MKCFRNRLIRMYGKSEVYFNLHKKCFSVKQDNLVMLHADSVMLHDVTFHVSEKGRQRVLAENRKNVHATVRGLFVSSDISEEVLPEYIAGMREAYYNPYTTSTFVDKATNEPIYAANNVVLSGKKIYYK